MQLMRQIATDRTMCLNLDCSEVHEFDPKLYEWIINYPREVLPVVDHKIKEIVQRDLNFMDFEDADLFQCRPYNLVEVKAIRDLDPIDVDKLISVSGMVTRVSSIIPDLRVANFRCEKCGRGVMVANDNGKVDEPEKCDSCGAKFCMSLVHNMCHFINKQVIKIQENPNKIPEGETPHAVLLYVYESNVDCCRPGDRVTITGLYRASAMRVNQYQRALQSLFRTYIDGLHVFCDEKSRLFSVPTSDAMSQGTAADASQGVSTSMFPQSQGTALDPDTQEPGATLQGNTNITHEQQREKEKALRALSRDPRLYDRLVASLAPNIWEMDDVKKGVLCMLFGGVAKNFPGGKVRGDINVLVVGDPSVSKSQILTYVHSLAPRGIYTSGKGSSAVGLTAYVTKDPETKEMVLESGALVLSDRGVCCIDEFDKMSDSARSMLHEAMEQQTVSIAKAGLISTLNARTSVLACANPVGSRWNPNISLGENINLPPTLLTRFDLIYLVRDKYDAERDRQLARHLVALFYENPAAGSRAHSVDLIPQETMREYIAYARQRSTPKISAAASEELIENYKQLRRDGRDRKVVVATPRQLESLIRLSESLARMKLRDEVLVEDVREAVRLWYCAMQSSAANESGDIEMDAIMTGMTSATREALRQLPGLLSQHLPTLLRNPKGTCTVEDLQKALCAAGAPACSRETLLTVLRQAEALCQVDQHNIIHAR